MIFKKIRKGHADWRNFLCSTPAMDYVFQKDAYEDQIDRAAKNIRNTDCVIIGAGAGASTAAGIQYGGKRFTDNFAEFIKKYGGHYMTDMYTAGFYPYPSEEAKWGYWSKHALMNRFDPPALTLYTELYDIVKDKEYFIDEQRFGPYALWHHKHFFEPTENGVKMTDVVHYALPLGFLGRIANALIVKNKLKEIFDYRFQKVNELFNSK